MSFKEYILVIKHGALGDFIIATSAFSAIRQYHPDAYIVLLTTQPFVELAQKMPYFDEIWVDARPKWWNLKGIRHTLTLLRGGDEQYKFKRIYDLQSSSRTAWYFRLLGKTQSEWVGKAKGCSHPRNIPDYTMHSYDMFQTHLTRIGFPAVPLPNVDWLSDDIIKFNLPQRFVLLVPGAALSRPKKRWTREGYLDVIRYCDGEGFTSVLLGGSADKAFIDDIAAHYDGQALINLVGKTSLGAIAELARHAQFAVGSDTGPMHVIAASGCPVLVLFSEDSDPKLHGPRAKAVLTIQVADLKDLSSQAVLEALRGDSAFSP